MPSFFSNRRLIVLLVSMITMVVVVGVTMEERPNPTWPEQFLQDSVGFVQSLAYKPARAVAGFFESIGEMKHIYTENQRLKANLQDHAQMVAKIKELESRNEGYQKLLEVESDLSDYKLRAAEVIMRSPERWYGQVTINRGEKHGIQPDMAVITTQGLVGRVQSVAQFSSSVELLTDSNRTNFVSAVVQGNNLIYGVIEGYDQEEDALYFRKVPMDAPLKKGQTVITSGLGGLFPRGLYIGEVLEVNPDQYGLTQTALVQPSANMYQLDYVFVVERSYIPKHDIPSIDELLTEEDPDEGTEDEQSREVEDPVEEGTE